MPQPAAILGWDIGGVNTKAARLAPGPRAPSSSICLQYELQRNPRSLGPVLQSAARQLDSEAADLHAVTMTAELSQVFRTKREGVAFVLDALETTFATDRLHVYTVSGKFVSPREARQQPLEVAASNWAATAHWVATLVPTCVLIDIGTTTTDLIPILERKVAATGRSDLERLGAGELIYTGALRTPVEAVAQHVPVRGTATGLAAEGFALMGDVYLWLKRLEETEYTWPTPDGRPATRQYAGERLARAVCADHDLLDDSAIDEIAGALSCTQLQMITSRLSVIRRRYPSIHTAVITGLGVFIAAEAARAAGLAVLPLSRQLDASPQTTPATAVASLLRESLTAGR